MMPMQCSPAHRARPVEIYKGDDTGAFAVRKIRISLTTPISMTGATAEFSLLSYRKTFSGDEIAANQMEVSFTSDVTKTFPLGLCFGSFRVIDAQGMSLTMTSRIPFSVVLPGASPTVRSDRVVIESDITNIRIQYEISYEQVSGKPKINGVTVSGNKSLADYGMASKQDLDGKVDKEEGKGLSSNDFTDADAEKLDGIEDGAEKNLPWKDTIPKGGIPKEDLTEEVRKDLENAKGGPFLRLNGAESQSVEGGVRIDGALTVGGDVKVEDDGSVARQAIADDFDASVGYARGDVVFRFGRLYKCTSDIVSPGPWNPSDWSRKTLVDIIYER